LRIAIFHDPRRLCLAVARQWLADLDRIERAVAQIHTPTGFASEAYTLREHIALVRRAVLERDAATGAPSLDSGRGDYDPAWSAPSSAE